ncbi:MAG: endolytic transglycosylase MltG [Eubacterium sp.]|nr:endolytic transglycosylase MltG [Eubacterium sp.]
MLTGRFSVKLIKWMIALVAATALVLIFLTEYKDYRLAYNKELTDRSTREGKEVTVVIPADASVKEIAAILHKLGLIQYEGAFVERLQNSEFRGKLKHGTYKLNTGMNTLQMMEIMASEEENAIIQRLTIPEGFTIDQIAERCEEKDICSARQFINACQSITRSKFRYLEDVPAGIDVRYRLEGYLFPATYDITENTTAESLVQWMLDTFTVYYNDELRAIAEERGLNSYQVVTMASMIERECAIAEERPVIAGVINNRLKADMLLQIDSTVLYPITEGMFNKPQVLYEDLEVDSPYNTYKYGGLPVGPICNPGIACITAVLKPMEHTYYYYHVVDEKSGEHAFYQTLEDHEQSINGVTVEDMKKAAIAIDEQDQEDPFGINDQNQNGQDQNGQDQNGQDQNGQDQNDQGENDQDGGEGNDGGG